MATTGSSGFMEPPRPPDDPEMQTIIDKLANFVARNGTEFERMTMNKQQKNPKFGFLFGGEHHAYYRWKVNIEQAYAGQGVTQAAPPVQATKPQTTGQWLPVPAAPAAVEETVKPPVVGTDLLTTLKQAKLKGQIVLKGMGITDPLELEFGEVVQSLMDSCTKEAISSGKGWIFGHTKTNDDCTRVVQFIVRKTLDSTGVGFDQKLHIVYLINDVVHNCLRKGSLELKQALEENVVQIFYNVLSSDGTRGDSLSKVLTIWQNQEYFSEKVLQDIQLVLTKGPAAFLPPTSQAQQPPVQPTSGVPPPWQQQSSSLPPPPMPPNMPPPPGGMYPGAPPMVPPPQGFTNPWEKPPGGFSGPPQPPPWMTGPNAPPPPPWAQNPPPNLPPPPSLPSSSQQPTPLFAPSTTHSQQPQASSLFPPSEDTSSFPSRDDCFAQSHDEMSTSFHSHDDMSSFARDDMPSGGFLQDSQTHQDDIQMDEEKREEPSRYLQDIQTIDYHHQSIDHPPMPPPPPRVYDYEYDHRPPPPDWDLPPPPPHHRYHGPPPPFPPPRHPDHYPPPPPHMRDMPPPPPHMRDLPPPPLPPDLPPPIPYFDLPAGLMVPLVPLHQNDYTPIDPRRVHLPPPQPPSERVLRAVEEFYKEPTDEKPRNDEGWEAKALLDFFDAKARALAAFQNRSRMPRHPPPSRRRRSRSRSYSPRYRRRSYSRSRSRSRSPRRRRRSSRSPSSRSRSSSCSRSRSRSPYYRRSRSPSYSPPPKPKRDQAFVIPQQVNVNTRIEETNVGHQLLKKMGWEGAGLGSGQQGIKEPIKGGQVRAKQDKYKGVGVNLNDPFEEFRRSKSYTYNRRPPSGST